jgi:hypothetical protein
MPNFNDILQEVPKMKHSDKYDLCIIPYFYALCGNGTLLNDDWYSYLSSEIWTFESQKRNMDLGKSVMVLFVAYRPATKWWLCKQRPFLDTALVNTFTRQWMRTQQ